MKTKIFAFLFTFTLILVEGQAAEKMNIIKTNVTAYAFRNINLTYERAFTRKFSVAVGFGSVAKGEIPFAKAYIADTDFENTQIGLSHFTVEPRIYFGEGYGKGFYLAPYYRNSSFKTDNAVYQAEFSTGTVPIAISGSAKANSLGLMLGTQWFLGANENWVLDFWIVGAHYGKGKGDFRGNSSRPLSLEEQQELSQELKNLDIPVVEYDVITDSNGATVVLNGPWAGLRSGLSFGYRF